MELDGARVSVADRLATTKENGARVNYVKAVLLTPIAAVGALTALPFVERTAMPAGWIESLAIGSLLGVAHLMILIVVYRICRWSNVRLFLGHGKRVWIVLIGSAYITGAASTLLLIVI